MGDRFHLVQYVGQVGSGHGQIEFYFTPAAIQLAGDFRH